MTLFDAVAVAAAGFAAGGVNAIAGSGSLITFPTLLAVGYSPVTANVTNTTGLVFGNVSSVWGYRAELEGQRRRGIRFVIAAGLGSVAGSVLLLSLPGSVFEAVVPALILLAAALMAAKPNPRITEAPETAGRRAAITGIAFFSGLYSGYFGAAAGIILISSLRLLIPERLQRLNGLKNLTIATANLVAALIFVFISDVAYDAAGLVAAGSIAGALVGSTYGRRIPDEVLRWLIVVVAVGVALVLIFK